VEESVACEDDLVVAILHEPADAVLRVARSVQGLDGNAAETETLTVAWRLGHLLAVFASEDLQFRNPELG
jgi:hypothetical protein